MRFIVLALLVAVAGGCQSVVQPFVSLKPDYTKLPADTLREIAREIETAVAEGNRDPQIADRDGIVVSDDVVRQAIRTRAARNERLSEFRATGFAYEKRNGLAEVRTGRDYQRATSRRERDRNALLVMSENQDRWALYEGIQDASRLAPAALPAIQRIFYEERIKLLPPGQPYEDDSGNIVTK